MSSDVDLWDAIVVGSGPAGATAALQLARHGLRVLILERLSWPRYKTCGGGLVWRARRRLDVAIDNAIEEEAYRADLHLHDCARAFSVTRDEPLVSMTMRSKLDEALTEAALEAGAEMKASCRVTGVRLLSEHVAVETSDGWFEARFLIAADGAAGTVAELSGWTANRRSVPALESEIRVTRETRERFSGIARFDFGVVPAGYAWVFPKSQTLSVGCLSFGRHSHALKRQLSDYLERLEIRPLAVESHGFVIPVAPRARRLAAHRVLLTGDSAGLVDPVTCEGISHAVLSGELAARAIVEQAGDSHAVLDRYQRALEDNILADLRYARVLAKFLYGTPRARRFVLRRLGQPLAEVMVQIITGDLTYRELLRRPSLYLRAARGLLQPDSLPYPKG